MNLDEKNRKLIIELDYKARTPIMQIARTLKLSKDSALYRLKKLEEENIITNYYAVIDYFKLGLLTYKIYIKFKSINEQRDTTFIQELKNHNCVRHVNLTTNDYDMILTLQTQNETELQVLCENIFTKFANDIQSKQIAFITNQHHFKHPLLKEKEPNKMYSTTLTQEKTELTSLEKEVLNILSQNARISSVDLAIKVKKKANSLLYTLKSLEKKGIVVGYRPRINFQTLKLNHFMISFNLNTTNQKEYNSFMKELGTLKGIIYITQGLASYDCECEIVTTDSFTLRKELDSLTKSNSNKISSMTIREIISTIPIHYFKI